MTQTTRNFCARVFGLLLFAVLCCTALAQASLITVNKQFSPNSVNLGGTSTVTITFQNNSTASSATITAFSDDISTMSGIGQFAASPNLATTCVGGTPTISGTVVSMNNGVIPAAPSSTTPGSCTITFNVVGAQVGNGFNTILASNVTTSLGSPSGNVTQTLEVNPVNVTVSGSTAVTTIVGSTAQITFTVTNPAASVPLTNLAFPVNASAAQAFQITNATTTCSGATIGALPPSGTSGTVNLSGATIPAGGNCTITLTVTSAVVTTVNFSLPANGVTNTQGVTNSSAGSTQAKFVLGSPNVSKSFSPTAVAQGGTTNLTINIQNVLTDESLTNAGEVDTLPSGLLLASSPAPVLTNCGSGTVTGFGTGTITFSGGTIPASTTCKIVVTVQVPASQAAGGYTNSIPIANFTSTQVNGAAAVANATLTVTGPGGGISMSKAFSPTSSAPNAPIKVTLTFNSLASGAFTGGTFTDPLPQSPVSLVGYVDSTHQPAFSAGCSGSASGSPTVTISTGATSVTGSHLAIPDGGSCVVTFYVEFPTPISVSRTDTNTVSATGVSFGGASGPINPIGGASANVTELPALSLVNYVASSQGLINQPQTVEGEIADASGTTDSNASATYNLNAGKVQLAPSPNFTFSAGCPSGIASLVTPGANNESFTIGPIPSISATCTFTYNVIDEGGVTGTYVPGNSTYTSTLTGGTAIPFTGTNSVTFSQTSINVTKKFTPNQIQAGSTAVGDVTLNVAPITGFATTQANGVSFTDSLPTGMSFASNPNVTFSAGCQQSGQPTPAFTITGTSIAFSGISLIANGNSPVSCDASFTVTDSTVGTATNQIPAHAITSTSGATNGAEAQASLTIASGLGLQKTFVNPTFAIGGNDYMRLLITNTASTSQLTGGALTDAMPSALALASLTEGPQRTGDPPLCGGTISGTVGASTFTLNGLTVAGSTASGPGQCVVYVLITSASGATAGGVTNTIPVGGLTIGGYSNQTAASAPVTLTVPPNVSILKAFSPTTIPLNGTSTLTITVTNGATGAVPLTGLGLTDTLPTNVTVASTPNASTTCGSGTVTATAGASTVTLANGSITAGPSAACTITVSVTSGTVGTYTNTIPASSVTTTQGATNSSPANASLTVNNAPNVTLAKSFSPTSIAPNGTSVLTITVSNTASGAVALSAMVLTDNLPTGIAIAATPNASTTCGSGSVTATAGGTSVALSGGSVGTSASNDTCTIKVNVTGATPNTYTNTIPASSLTTTQGATNGGPATAQLTISAPNVTVAKAFSPASIFVGGTSRLTITVSNTASGAIPLSGMSLTDNLPTNVTIASTPSASTTCGSGSVAATAGGTSVALSGGSIGNLASNDTCTISVNVTSTVTASYTNTIASGSVTTTQGATNSAPATAPLTVNSAPNVTLAKSFSPTTIAPNGTSVLTITVSNTAAGAVNLSGMSLTDTLPTGITVGSTPGASTTCGSGSVTANAGATSVSLSGGSIGTAASNDTCTIKVNVTGAAPSTYTNTIPASSITTSQGATNSGPATAQLTITAPNVSLVKSFAPSSTVSGGTSTLTITVLNNASGAVPLTGLALTDNLPTNVTIASPTNAATTCGAGAVGATAGGTSVSLSNGSIGSSPSNDTCTITVTVTGTVAGNYTNTIPASSVTSTQGATNSAPATAPFTIVAPNVTLAKAFSPTSIFVSGTSTLTITVSNTAAGAIPLTGMALTDTLPTNVKIASTPNASTTCGSGTVAATAGGTSVALAGGSIGNAASNDTCTISVNVTSTVPGNYVNTIPASSVTTTQGPTNGSAANAPLTVSTAPNVTLAKAFNPTSIVPGGASTLTITVANTAAGAVNLTGLALTDNLPTNITIASTPNASTTCGSGTVAATAGGTSVALSGGSVSANASCTITVSVTGTIVNSYTNTIPASSVTSTQGATNVAPATAPLTIVSPNVTLTKAFSPTQIAPTGVSRLTITVANTAAGSINLTGMQLTDTLPSGITIASTPNASTTCGSGTVAATPGGTSVGLSSGSVSTNSTCTIAVNVTGTAIGSYTNTIPAGGLTTTQGAKNGSPATAPLSIANAPPVSLSKAFSPASFVSGQTSMLTITVANTAVGAVGLTGLALTDNLPSNVTIAPTPNGSTTCGSGTVAATAGGASVALSGGSVGPSATCSISVSVTGTVTGNYTNTIPAGAVTSNQGASNTAPATAPVTISPIPPVTLAKTFSPAQIFPGQTSVLTITVANTAATAIPLTGLKLTDNLPTNVTVGPTPNASTTCPGGTVAATAGGASVALSGGSIGNAASTDTCTITVTVTSATIGTWTNTIPGGAVGTTQGATNANPATAPLTVNPAPSVTLSKSFNPTAIFPGQTSTLTITVANTASGAVPLTGLSLTDNLPTNVTISPAPNQSTTCGSGTVSATAGGTSVSLSGGSVGANASNNTCTISVSVTSSTIGTYTNTIPTGGLTSNQGASNTSPATAPITVNPAPNVSLSKAFSPTSIFPGGTSTLTITVANTASGAVPLTGISLTDTLPTGITIASTPNASSTCGSGQQVVTATAGGTSVGLTKGSVGVGASATCTITVSVTGTVVASYTNTIPAGGLTSNQGASNTSPATAPLTINPAPDVSISKAFAPKSILPGGTSTLTITVANTAANAVPLTNVKLTDDLPTGITIAPTPNASTTCVYGSVAATAGGTSVTLSNASIGIGASATCTITVSVTGTKLGDYTNTIPAGGLTSTQGATNKSPATAPITIANAPDVTLSKVFDPVTIYPGGTSKLTISIANTAPGAYALTGLKLTDNLPTGITVASTPDASTTCGSGSVAATAGGTSVALSSGAVAANATCTITVSVTGTAIGDYTNTIPAGGLTSNQGASNGGPATAPIKITAAPPVTLSKVFDPVKIYPGGTSKLTISIANTAAGAIALSSVALTDTMPANITIASTPDASTTCGAGTVSATGGGTTVALSGGSIAANATCTISVNVTGTVLGDYTNTISKGSITSKQGASNTDPATAPIQIASAPPVTLSKVFNPVTITPGGTSKLTISIANTAAGAIALSNVALTDTMPANITIASTPDASTTCGSGTVSATAGGTTIALSGGSMPANATCTISVNVTGTVLGDYTNMIPKGSVTSKQGATNTDPATAPIKIHAAPPVTLSKVFSPEEIIATQTSRLTISIANTAPGAIDLSGMKLTDTLPAGVTVASNPNASTSCGTGNVTAATGGTSVTLTGGSVAADATCTIAVNVTGSVAGNYVNQIPTGSVTTAQGSTNKDPATAPLKIDPIPGVIVSKSFSPKVIAPDGSSMLTIAIANTKQGAIALSGLSLTDALPTGLTVASAPNAATTCTGGSVNAPAGSTSVSLANASIAAGTTCTITVAITGKESGSYVNTIPSGSVHTTQGATNTDPAHGTLTIGAPSLSVVKSSDPQNADVEPGQRIAYTIEIHNTGTMAERNATITDTLTNAKLVPGSVRVNGQPAPDAVVTEHQPFGSVPPNSTVTITYSATVDANATPGSEVTNDVVVGGEQACTGSSCRAGSPPNTIKKPALEISKTVNGVKAIKATHGEVVTYGITVKNTGQVPADDVVVTDPVPTGVTPVAGSATLDGKPVSATIDGQVITIPIGTLAADASAELTFRAMVSTTQTSGVLTNTASVDSRGSKPVNSNPANITPIPTTLVVTKTASATVVSAGDRVNYVITVTPPAGASYRTTTIVDTLPNYETYATGTARINGQPIPEPKVAGQALTWTLPSMHGTVTIAYATVIGLGAPPNGSLTNIVDVTAAGPPGTKPATGGATATVLVVASTLGSCYPITGRVYLDVKQSGQFQEGDIGIPGVSIYLDDGEYVVTDPYGRYNFPCVRPGMHALRLDDTTLPQGVVPYDDRNIDSEKSIERLVHKGFDQTIIEDINFAVTGQPASPIPNPNASPSPSSSAQPPAAQPHNP